MSLFIATGTNLGDKKNNLEKAKNSLCEHFVLIDESRIYTSPAVEYLNQDDFYNQVLEFEIPKISPDEIMNILFEIETSMGRIRNIPKGPRIIDLDIIFIKDLIIQTLLVNIPHPAAMERSFVILPLTELKGFKELQKHFTFPNTFNNIAHPISIDLSP